MSWQVKITVLRGGRAHFSASFTSSPITIGARPQNDVVLNDPFVSGEHALVVVSRGELLVRDKSTNGTFYQQRRLQEISLGQSGRIAIPPFEIDLALEVDEHAWKTAMRKDILRDLPGELAEPPGAQRPAPILETTLPPIPHLPPPPTHEPTGAHERSASPGNNRFFVEVVGGPEDLKGRLFILPDKPATFGRAEGAEILLPTTTISREHARLTPLGAGLFQLADLGSSNGCFVGGQRVGSAELGEGAEFGLADVVFRLRRNTLDNGPARRTAPREATPPLPPPPSLSGGVLIVNVRAAAGRPEYVFVDVRGRIDAYNYTQLTDSLDAAITDGGRFLSLDLAQVDYISAPGLGGVVKALTRLQQLRGDLCLVGASKKLCDAISLSRLDHLFRERLAATHDDALALWRSRVR